MEVNREMKHMTAQLLSGMLANPHLYPTIPGRVSNVWLLVVEGVRCTPSTTNNHTSRTSPHSR